MGEHEPHAERGHLEQLQPVVVVAPQVDERRQQQRPAPRVGDRAERPAGVDDREPVVGDDLGDVAVEQAAGLAQVQGEVVALGVAVAVQGDGDGPPAGDDDGEDDRPDERPALRADDRCRRVVVVEIERLERVTVTAFGRGSGSRRAARPPCPG